MKGRAIERLVKATKKGPLRRLIGTVDVDGAGTAHGLPEVDPFILLDAGIIPENNLPPFGKHPHRGHSVVTILLEGRVSSWDSFNNQGEEKTHVMRGPCSYWVDAGSGLFHDERSVISSNADLLPKLFQLWVGVKEEDRQKPPRVQWDEDLPRFTCYSPDDKVVVGTGVYHVGELTSIETLHPITVAHICQQASTTYQFPVTSQHGGFVVSLKGTASFGGTPSQDDYDVMVLGEDQGSTGYLEIQTRDVDAEYLVCSGEKIGEKWAKKLVANGAIIAATEAQARELAPRVEEVASNGKAQGGSFAPFGI